ncbi:hypothetical protein CHCC14814_3771 [Bacillus paralicheniformis]|nr:hypothetical protein CHCC14814_3771 [Bacillus paralicheniformis]
MNRRKKKNKNRKKTVFYLASVFVFKAKGSLGNPASLF